MSDHENNSHHSQDSDDQEEDFDKPLVPNKVYESPSQDETIAEIENFRIKASRPLIKMQFIKQRKMFGTTYKFNDSDAQEKTADIRSLNDPFFHIKNKVIDIGLQGSNHQVASSTQTTWNRKINKAIEIKDEKISLEIEDDNQEIIQFLDNVYKEMEEALQSNETIDIFQNDFDLFAGDDFGSQNETTELSTQIKEWKTFSYLVLTRSKKVSCIQFQPSTQLNKSRYIAAAFTEILNFDDRVVYSYKSHKNYIFLWEYDDLHTIDPVMALISPLEITCFAFNPKDPNIIVGGCANGQIMMWDLKQSTQFTKLTSKKKQQTKKEKDEIFELSPVIISALQDPSGVAASLAPDIVKKGIASHKNPVLCLEWFPANVEIDRKHIEKYHPPNQGELHQFATISCDGMVLIWDTRFGDPKDKNKSLTDLSTVLWKAIYGIQLFRPEGGGQMGGAQLQFRKNQKTPVITVTSDEGELCLLDISVKPTEENPKSDLVTKIWQHERHLRPTIGLDVSPFYEDIVLTLHDFHFCIWKHSIDVPIFESSILKDNQITCGQFSPNRPGVIMIGKMNGSLDIWDLIDQSHQQTQSYPVGGKPLSYMRFHESNPHNLAIGDTEGQIHIIELPSTLARITGDEIKSMANFWQREVERVKYFNQRFQIREDVFKQEKQDREKFEAMEEQKGHKEDDKKNDEEDQLEAEYQQFAQQYIREVIKGLPPLEVEEKDKKKKQ